MNYWRDQTAFHLAIKYVLAFIFHIRVISKSSPSHTEIERKKREVPLDHFALGKVKTASVRAEQMIVRRLCAGRGEAGRGTHPLIIMMP